MKFRLLHLDASDGKDHLKEVYAVVDNDGFNHLIRVPEGAASPEEVIAAELAKLPAPTEV